MAMNVTRATHVCGLVRTWRCDGGCYEGECREQRARPRGERGPTAADRAAEDASEGRRQS
jgi:hypothetical protein